MNRWRLYEKARRAWGDDAQVMMLFEEMSELTTEICHSCRSNKVSFACDVINEIADVQIMLEQLMVIMGLTPKEVEIRKLEKLGKLERMLEEK